MPDGGFASGGASSTALSALRKPWQPEPCGQGCLGLDGLQEQGHRRGTVEAFQYVTKLLEAEQFDGLEDLVSPPQREELKVDTLLGRGSRLVLDVNPRGNFSSRLHSDLQTTLAVSATVMLGALEEYTYTDNSRWKVTRLQGWTFRRTLLGTDEEPVGDWQVVAVGKMRWKCFVE